VSDEDEERLKAAVDGAYQLPKVERVFRNIIPFLGMRQSGSLRMRFEQWVNDGNLAWVFDNEVDTLSLDFEVIGFDMTSVLSDPSLCTPLYYYLFHRIEKLLDGTKTRIVVAEGWKALQDDVFRQQIKDWSSTPRKKEGFLVLDTQAPEDIAQSEIGCKIIQESVTQIYFANPKARYEDYVTHFGLSDKEYEIVKTLDKSSRFFLLKQGKSSVVVRADLTNFQDEMAVLSGRTQYSALLDGIRQTVGDDPRHWLPVYLQDVKKLKII
jgi:type IV secretion system protein VirB4